MLLLKCRTFLPFTKLSLKHLNCLCQHCTERIRTIQVLTLKTLTLNFSLCSERCRYTLYGHTDSVNSIEFFPYSNTLLTGSADKSLSIWDARTVSKSLMCFFFPILIGLVTLKSLFRCKVPLMKKLYRGKQDKRVIISFCLQGLIYMLLSTLPPKSRNIK